MKTNKTKQKHNTICVGHQYTQDKLKKKQTTHTNKNTQKHTKKNTQKRKHYLTRTLFPNPSKLPI
jgi:hypothetical protein